ncbi:MAG: hypothetical protein J6Y85_01390, partial [Alphaproteobacteria bacterium]|nr:hypothetical protein [Alphaproteobacteria bacterium]
GGTWITAHSATDEGCDAAHCNGLNFCRSAQKMNFFSALIWCKSIGHKLTDVETVCPNGLASGQTCANANNFGNVWTDMPSPSNSNRMVYLSGKNQLMLNHDSGNRNNSASLNAICKE